jgi:hypothetical protein
MSIYANGWKPGIGDPTIIAWIIVIAYLLAAVLCASIVKPKFSTRQDIISSQERLFWFSLALFMLLMGINKQLDLQTWLIRTSIAVAKATGLYGKHHIFQLRFFLIVATASLLLILYVLIKMRKYWRQHLLALGGILLLFIFELMRLISFNHIDEMVHLAYANIHLNWLLELGGIMLICTSAMLRIRNYSQVTGRKYQKFFRH